MEIPHHVVFQSFTPWAGHVPTGFIVDSIGVRIRVSFFESPRQRGSEDRYEQEPLPAFDEEYVEWVTLLEAVAEARDCFTMMELGAGYGRWLARGAAAARRRGIPYHLIGVEAEPTHFQWMRQAFQDNDIRPWEAELVQAAVSSEDGVVWFLEGEPQKWYGQCVASKGKRQSLRSLGIPLLWRVLRRGALAARQVRAVSLATLLQPLRRVDLIDIDVQNDELEVLTAAQDLLAQKVRHVHIGTHSRRAEVGLRQLFRGILTEEPSSVSPGARARKKAATHAELTQARRYTSRTTQSWGALSVFGSHDAVPDIRENRDAQDSAVPREMNERGPASNGPTLARRRSACAASGKPGARFTRHV